MSFIQPGQNRTSYQQGSPSVIPNEQRKVAYSLNDALQEWEDHDEIKYHQGESNRISYYYSDSQQPEGFLESGQRFFTHLANPETQSLHRQAIDAVIKDLKDSSTFPAKGVLIEQNFKLRKVWGQPLSIGALKRSLDQIKDPSSSQSFSPLFNIFGKPGTPKPSSILRGFFSSSEKRGYQRIPENDDK